MARTQKNTAQSSKLRADAFVTHAPPVVPASKTAQVKALVERSAGATLADLAETTGWLPHTIRAALSGLRKKGHRIAREKRDGRSVYIINKVG